MRQDGPETNKPVTVLEKELREDTSTSGYQSCSLDTDELKEKLRVKLAEAHNLSPCSAHMDAPQKETLAHRQPHQLTGSALQETIPVKSPSDQILEDNFLREQDKTMPSAIKPFRSLDPPD